MNIRIITLFLTLVAPFVLAQEPPRQAAKAVAAERAAMLETLQRGKAIRGCREQYRLLPEMHAVERKTSTEIAAQTFARIGASGAQFVESKGRLVLFRSAQPKTASVEDDGATTVFPVVLNRRTGTFGVLTGTLVVKPKRMADAAAIASSHGLQEQKAYPHLQTVFYQVQANTDIADVVAALLADPRVDNAYPEIIEHVRLPQ